MMKNIQFQQVKNHITFITITGLWILYTILYVGLKQHGMTTVHAGYLALIAQVSLDVIASILAFYLWKRVSGKKKIIFALFSLSLFLNAITDFNFNLFVNILGIANYTEAIASSFDITFICFLFLQLLAWIFIFIEAKPRRSKLEFFTLYLPIAIITLIVLITFFLGSYTWKVQTFSLLSLYPILEAILQVLGFVFAALCLSAAYNKQIRLISIGYLIIIAGGFIVQLSHLTQTIKPLSFLESTWVLGQLLIVFGFYGMFKNLSDLKTKKWLNKFNSVQVQCAFLSFLLCIAALVLVWIIVYILEGEALFKITPLQHLPSMLIIFSIVAVLISSAFARAFSSPFKRIENIISSYSERKEPIIINDEGRSNIAEFVNLENFLNKTFSDLKEKNNAIKSIGAGVAHELRTPIRSIISGANGLEKYLPILTDAYNLAKENGLPVGIIYPHQWDLLYSLTERLKSEGSSANIIVDMLLMNIRESDVEKSKLTTLSMVDCIKKALNRYSFQRGERELIHLNTQNDFKFKSDELLIIHIIFNLMKNALYYIADAEKGEIIITLEKSNNVNKLYFKDTSKGISQKILPHIFDHFFSQTENGTGIGLSFCKMAMQQMGGDITCRSQEGEFTEFLLTFPVLESSA